MQTIFVERLVEENKQWIWKSFPETFDLEKDFQIDEANLNYEICRMGQLLASYGMLSAEMSSNLQRKEGYVKLIKARVAAALRSEAESKNIKLTENKLEEQVIMSEQYQQVLNQLHVLRADVLKIENWYRALVKKADLLNALAFRQSAELKRMPG